MLAIALVLYMIAWMNGALPSGWGAGAVGRGLAGGGGPHGAGARSQGGERGGRGGTGGCSGASKRVGGLRRHGGTRVMHAGQRLEDAIITPTRAKAPGGLEAMNEEL
jgi:hypothetical protein